MPRAKPATLSEPVRLNLFLARFAGISRRRADMLIARGSVSVNSKPARLGQKISPEADRVYLSTKLISPSSSPHLYLILNKPPGFITTTRDQFGRPSVVDLIPASPRLYPVGRLDYATSGLLLFTNDGQLSLRLTHPRYHLPKTYQLITLKAPTSGQISQISRGVVLDDGPTQPAVVKLIGPTSQGFCWQLTITEGRNRQIRRLCFKLTIRLLSLARISLGPLKLGPLPPGHYRYLTAAEVDQLKKVVQ